MPMARKQMNAVERIMIHEVGTLVSAKSREEQEAEKQRQSEEMCCM
jgi:hypothetical protein